jgi:hypothetical protein
MREKNFPLMTLLKLQLIINITRSQRKTEKTVILKFTTSLQPASSKPPASLQQASSKPPASLQQASSKPPASLPLKGFSY